MESVRAYLSKFLTSVSLFTLLAVALPSYAQTPSGYIGQFIQISPADSTLGPITANTDISEFIDNVVIEVLKTRTGKIFCSAFKSDDDLKQVLFVNPQRGAEGVRLCSGYPKSDQNFKIFPKSYWRVTTNDESFHIAGWTTPRNETVLVMPQVQSSADVELLKSQLAQTIVHELTISLDRKERMGFLGMVSAAKLGLVVNENSCKVVSIIKNAQLKHMLSSMRAFDLEKKIETEMGLKLPARFAEYRGAKTCGEKIKFLSPYFSDIAKLLQGENLIRNFLNAGECLEVDGDFSAILGGNSIALSGGDSLVKKAEQLDQINLQFSDGSEKNACQFLSEGLPFYPGASFNGGPGPRLGGAGW